MAQNMATGKLTWDTNPTNIGMTRIRSHNQAGALQGNTCTAPECPNH